ncbi:MAG TPA: 50S ribosomal protein L9 [Candidatus Paceibacterota bacterium]
MKVLLLKDVVKVGQRGEVVEVKDGFGRNYLIRQGFARIADIGSIRAVEAKKAAQLERETAKKGARKEYKKKLSGYTVTLTRKANEKGHLFAGVTAANIVATLHKDGYDFVCESDLSGFPLKTTGGHEVSLKTGEGEEIPIHIHIKPL